MNLDPTNFASPEEFCGFRFVDHQILDKSLLITGIHNFQIPEVQKPSQFTDMSNFPFWGAGKMAW
ncbi:hypothetical protein GGS26DRAFT_575221 [Hypomontagnella submonticulosa]|nr:hypothetical protein GGS26DRAFT_575221 [Hypomontagnella submonticulosa]